MSLYSRRAVLLRCIKTSIIDNWVYCMCVCVCVASATRRYDLVNFLRAIVKCLFLFVVSYTRSSRVFRGVVLVD